MITVMTSWEDIDEYPTGVDVNVLHGGMLMVVPALPEGPAALEVRPLAIYAPGAWMRVEHDEASTQLVSFLSERGLTEEWKTYGTEEVST